MIVWLGRGRLLIEWISQTIFFLLLPMKRNNIDTDDNNVEGINKAKKQLSRNHTRWTGMWSEQRRYFLFWVKLTLNYKTFSWIYLQRKYYRGTDFFGKNFLKYNRISFMEWLKQLNKISSSLSKVNIRIEDFFKE